MKRLLRSYTSFTRPERSGLIGLCALLAMVVAFKAMTPNPANEARDQERIVAAYRQQNEAFLNNTPKRQQTATNEIVNAPTQAGATVQSEKSVQSEVLTKFDPNTVDSLTLRRFGLKPHTISNLMKWRAKGKRFYHKEDLKPLYTLTTEEYNMLAPYIDIKRQQIDINHADSATLLRLYGIGPKIAHKILVRRSTLGPFTHHNQLKELYKFPNGVFEKLVEEIVITP